MWEKKIEWIRDAEMKNSEFLAQAKQANVRSDLLQN